MQTQVLQRHLKSIDGLSAGDRDRLDAGLAAIFSSASALGDKLAHLPPAASEHATPQS